MAHHSYCICHAYIKNDGIRSIPFRCNPVLSHRNSTLNVTRVQNDNPKHNKMPISSTDWSSEIHLHGTLEEYQDLCHQVSELTIEEASEELHDAARYGEPDTVRAILATMDVVDIVDTDHSTPLHKACANGHVDCVRWLIRYNATHTTNAAGNTPLHWAAANGHDKVVQLLLEHFKDIDVLTQNKFGRSALTEGFASNNTEVANLLLSHDSATEEKLLLGSTPTVCDDADPMHVDSGITPDTLHSITHEFSFGIPSSTSVSTSASSTLQIRELPIAHADDPFGQIPADDTTGFGIWAASLVMAQWITSISDRFNNTNVLELGAGCGVPGLAAAIASNAHSVIVTDLNTTTVENLHYNIGLNHYGKTQVTAAKIDWDDSSTYPSEKVDFVIGSDLIYQKSIVPYLKKVVLGVLKEGKGTFLYVAPDTGRDGLPEFIESMNHDGFHLVNQHLAPKTFHSNPLTNEDDDECYLHFHELASSTYVLYEFVRTCS